MRLFQKFVLGYILLSGSNALNAQQPKFELIQPEIFSQKSSMTHAWADYDNDGDLDLYVGFRKGSPNRLYRNDGGVMKNVAAELGVADLEDTRAFAWGDYNADGLLDLYVGYTSGARADFAKIPCRIYRNDGKKFIEVTKSLGLNLPLGNARQLSWIDYDNDGWVDLYAHGKLYKNEKGKFKVVTPEVIKNNGGGYGSVWADYDNDGAMDLCISSSNHYIIHNLLSEKNARRSLKVMVVNGKGIYTKAGIEVRLYQKGTRKLIGSRIISAGSDYNCQSAMAVHFGLPRMKNVDVEITTMTNDGRKTARLENVDPKKYTGKYLSIKVDSKGKIVK